MKNTSIKPAAPIILSRRKFVKLCASYAAMGYVGATWLAEPTITSAAERVADDKELLRLLKTGHAKPKAKVQLVFAHVPSEQPTWPYKGYNYEAKKQTLLAKLQKACPKIEFIPATAMNAEQAANIIKSEEDVDGFVVCILGIWTGVAGAIMRRSGKPVVVINDLFAGDGEYVGIPGAIQRENLKVASVSSSNFDDVIRAVRLFEVIKAMHGSKIVVVCDWDIGGLPALVEGVFGTKIEQMKLQELHSYYEGIKPEEARPWALRWIKNAKRVVEPTEAEIIKSARMFLAMLKVMRERRADVITIDCLGGFYSGRLQAYPCLGYCDMNSHGSVGGCEADVNSALTMLWMLYLTGIPGYISDPCIDTNKGWIIYAHCVAPYRAYGLKSKPTPYIIRSHAEDRRGASIQSLLPLGHKITTLQTNIWERAIVMHQGITVANISDEKACRTKLAAKANVEAIQKNWRWGWHRVTFYGDWRSDVINFATLLGLRVIEEDV